MSIPKGYSSDKGASSKTPIKHQTIQPLGQGRYGTDSMPLKGLFPINAISYVPLATSTNQIIHLVGHLATVGSTILFDAGVLSGQEVTVVEVIDVDHFRIGNVQDAAITAADTFRILTTKSVQVDSSGNFTISSGPVQYVKDTVNTQATIDTATPANNAPLPVGVYMQKDGVIYPVNKDTGTPANTLALPVEIVGVNGTEINITAGDINVQTTHLGANADSMRIGNGVNELGINANLEALTHDTDALAQLIAMEAKQDAIITELQKTSESSVHESVFSLAPALDVAIYTAIGAAIPAGTTIKEIRVNYKAGDTLELFDANAGNSLGMITQGGGSLPVKIVGDNVLRVHARAINANFTATELVVNLIK